MSRGKATAWRVLCVLAVASLAATRAFAQQQASASSQKSNPETLEEVIVTGSLIPQERAETSNPTLVIDADDLQLKGFTTVADALQHTSIATGAIQGPQFVNGFTPGAQVISLFGLSPSYTKYLIDGRPIADYPALYNGTDIVVSIDGIPTVLIDHVDILPGGQSSIYGSDAIAGVVNINLKKKMDGAQLDLRYGWTKDGGGTEKRIGLADGFSAGNFEMVFGGQWEKTDPIWGYQRPLTNQYFAGGSSPQTAERDWLILGLFGQPNGDLYYFEDPNNCANVASQFGGTVGLQTRANRGQYCGTFSSGYYTINNGGESEQGYLHAGLQVNDSLKVFSDVLLNHGETIYNTGTSFFSSADDSSGPYYYYYDPNVAPCIPPAYTTCDLLNLQRIFSPEEAGNLRDQSNKNTTNSIRATLGIEGRFGSSNWNYLVDFTYTDNKLIEATHLAFTDQINNFFSSIFGPNLGPDATFGQPTYAVNYTQFYQPITPLDYASFTGYATSHSYTEDTLARAQLTNSALFALPGGNAGLAIVAEGGAQGWDYSPDPRFLNGEAYLYTATAGSGHRSRTAATMELRLPLLPGLVADASGRYDDYHVSGTGVTKSTYTFSLEYHPVKSLLLRGRYGTSFKAPTLSDEFQGTSGFFQTVTDYYYCYTHGYTTATISNCPQSGESIFGTTSGNPALRPITAKNWSLGVAWKPAERLQFTYDVLHWQISNEVQQQDSDQLLRTEAACRLGQLDINSPTCVAALAEVTRDVNGLAIQISTPKINVASENLTVGVLAVNYTLDAGVAGTFKFDGSYSDLFKHTLLRFPGDAEINLLDSPFYSTEFKSKENVGVTWNLHKFESTLYVERYGKTPNYLAQQQVDGYATPGAADVGVWTIANLSARYEISDVLQVSANVNNLFNKMPPPDPSQPGIANQPFSIFNYNNYGRSYFVGLNYKFDR